MHFSKALFLVSCAISCFATTVNDVKNQITSLSSQLDVITLLVQAFPNVGGTALQALGIQTVAMAVLVGVDTLTTVVEGVSPSPVSEQDGRSVLDQMEALEPNLIAASQLIISKKTAFSLVPPFGLPTGGVIGLIRQDLANLKIGLNAAEDAIEAAAPASLLDEGNAFRDRINTLLDTTIQAYA